MRSPGHFCNATALGAEEIWKPLWIVCLSLLGQRTAKPGHLKGCSAAARTIYRGSSQANGADLRESRALSFSAIRKDFPQLNTGTKNSNREMNELFENSLNNFVFSFL